MLKEEYLASMVTYEGDPYGHPGTTRHRWSTVRALGGSPSDR